MIVSFFDGRIRLRDSALKDPETLLLVQNLISAQDGVQSMSSNPKTGSLLVRYDPAKISREALLEAAAALEEQLAPKRGEPTDGQGKRSGWGGFGAGHCRGKGRMLGRKQETTLLGALYGATVMGGFWNKRVHVASGVLFTFLTIMHVYSRRKLLR